jgi:hypothetical protein
MATFGQPSRRPTELEPTFVVAAGDDVVFLYGDLVVVQEAFDPPWWREREWYALPVAEATAHLFGRTLRIHQNGAPWMEVDDVEDVAVGRDFIEELRRLRWQALGTR